MTNLKPTTEKPSRKDAIVSDLLLGIKSFDRALMTHWRFLLIGVPLMTIMSTSLGYLTAPEPCRQSFNCVELHIVKSTQPLFSWITELDSLSDEGKLPVLIAIACWYLYVFAAVLYALRDVAIVLRTKGGQNNAG